MTVILDDHKLSYVAVPKVACTSVKSMFFEIENGFAFRMFRASGRHWHIHDFYPSVPFGELPHRGMSGHLRVALVRDPIRRLLSCYGNRVVHHGELSQARTGAALRQAGLPVDPDLRSFVHHLDGYRRAVPSIEHHARPMVDYLGRNPAFYAHLFPMEAIGAFAELVRHVTGTRAGLERLQTGGPKIPPDTLGPAERRVLETYYAEDYALYGPWL